MNGRIIKSLVIVIVVFALGSLCFAQTPSAAPVRPLTKIAPVPEPGDLPTGFLPNPAVPPGVKASIEITPQQAAMQPASLDWRSAAGVTSVKDQNPWGTCWIFGSIGDFESKVKLKEAPSTDPDYSEWDMWDGNAQGIDNGGGNTRQVANHFIIYGTINETDAPYQTASRPGPPYPDPAYWSPSPPGTPQKTVREWHYLYNMDTVGQANALKTYIQNNGPVTCSVRVDTINTWSVGPSGPGFAFNTYNWNSNWVVPYLSTALDPDHCVLLVGWDDSKAWYGGGGTGAWLVKNSWGTAWGAPSADAGYFWIAYGSARIGAEAAYYPQNGYKGYDSSEGLLYYDSFGCFSSLGYTSPSNDYDVYAICAYTPSFTGTRYLNYVEFWGWDATMNYEIKVFDTWDRSGTPSSQLGTTVSGSVTEMGYYSIPMNAGIQLTSGNEIFIQVRFTDPQNLNPYLIPYEFQVVWFPNTKTNESAKCYSSPTGTSGWFDTSTGGFGDIGIRGRHGTTSLGVNDWLVY